MKEKLDQAVLNQLLRNLSNNKLVFGAVFYISSDDKSVDVISSCGNMTDESQYYIASINKLFVSALILKLNAEHKLDLRDKISKYLPEELVRGLHIFQGMDYSNTLEIFHLISQTSGLPCYLIDQQANGTRAMTELEAGIDQAWPIDKVVTEVKKMTPHFPPGKEGKAKYVDTNHQLLGLITENIIGDPINIVLRGLFQDLNMAHTYVIEDEKKQAFTPIYFKSKELHLLQFLSSTKNDIVSTAKDQMVFLKAFFNGYFFPREKLSEFEKWNPVFFPFHYGIGLQKFSMPRIFSPFQPVPAMLGHSGSTGSVAFYVPEKEVYITGTVNQQASPNLAFQTMIKILSKLS